MLTRVSFVLIVYLCLSASQGTQADKYVTGKVTHVGTKELVKNLKVQVELRDTSLMDVASKLVGSLTITDATSFPISYKVKYDPSLVKAGHQYSMSARITGSDGKLLYINDVHTPADLSGANNPNVDIAVIKVGDSSPVSPAKTDGKKACAPACRGKPKACAYGYQKKDGCDICKCNDPCNPPGKAILCGPKERCFVEKKPDGTFGTRCGTGSNKNHKNESPSDKSKCQEPKVVGHCRATLPRFHYNSASKMCEPFTYGGCGGNSNNFLSKAACEKACKA